MKIDDATFLIGFLGVLAVVGIYLFVFMKKMGAFLQKFSAKKGLHFQRRDEGQLEKQLSKNLEIVEKGLVRAINSVRYIVRDGDVCMYRCTELLDLNPHGQTQSSHFLRIGLSFPVAAGPYCFFLFDPKSQKCIPRLSGSGILDRHPCFEKAKAFLQGSRVAHSVSVTFAGGSAFLYFEGVQRGWTEERLEQLWDLGTGLSRELQ